MTFEILRYVFNGDGGGGGRTKCDSESVALWVINERYSDKKICAHITRKC